MYGFFYAIAHLPLSNAMVFTYSSPVFIPLVAWLFLKERITPLMLLAAAVGMVGVVLLEGVVGGVEPVPVMVWAAWGLRPLAAVAMVMLGLRANSAGGFGARVPMPPQGGGSGFA